MTKTAEEWKAQALKYQAALETIRDLGEDSFCVEEATTTLRVI
jgi:hypothetical protein